MKNIVDTCERTVGVVSISELACVLVANMCDKNESERQVLRSEGEDWAKAHGMNFYEASAKSRINVEEAFFDGIRRYRDCTLSEPYSCPSLNLS